MEKFQDLSNLEVCELSKVELEQINGGDEVSKAVFQLAGFIAGLVVSAVVSWHEAVSNNHHLY